MAIPVPIAAGAGVGEEGGGTSLEIPQPTTLLAGGTYTREDGDIAVIAVASSVSNTLGVSTGWTEIVPPSSNSNMSTAYWYRRLDGGANDTPTVSFSAASSGTDGHRGRMIVFRGVKTSGDPWSTTPQASSITNTATPATQALTTADTDCLAVTILQVDDNQPWDTAPPPDGWDQDVADFDTSVGPDGKITVITKDQATDGTVGSVTIGTFSPNPEICRSLTFDLVGATGGGAEAPVNTVAPAVTGTPTVGHELSCTEGTWDNEPDTFAYQWRRDTGGGMANIMGATSATYTLVEADDDADILCRVTATNEGGSTQANSNTVTDVGPLYEVTDTEATLEACAIAALIWTEGDADAPTNVTPPVIAVASGTLTVGYQVEVSAPGEWSETPDSLTYQWQRDDGGGFADIPGAVDTTYVLTIDDDDCDIQVLETAFAATTPSEPEPSNTLGPVGPYFLVEDTAAVLQGGAEATVVFTAGDTPGYLEGAGGSKIEIVETGGSKVRFVEEGGSKVRVVEAGQGGTKVRVVAEGGSRVRLTTGEPE